MISYTTVGTNNVEKAAKFYDELFALLGAKRFMDYGSFIAWGVSPNKPMFAVTTPYNKETATVGNGVMIALSANSKEQVEAVHKKALELGAKDEGAVGPRGENFYVGYFRDLDGNKLNIFHASF